MTSKLPKAMKREFVKALRSGEYKQTQGRLCDGEGFCAMGVFYDACVDGDWVRHDYYPHLWGVESDFGIDAYNLPDDVTPPGWRYGAVVGMNDGGSTFEEIADYVEANY